MGFGVEATRTAKGYGILSFDLDLVDGETHKAMAAGGVLCSGAIGAYGKSLKECTLEQVREALGKAVAKGMKPKS